ncbi:MAG: TraM recognition domain-containing protein [Bdellovibrionota bacterium]
MARDYKLQDSASIHNAEKRKSMYLVAAATLASLGLASAPFLNGIDPSILFVLGMIPAAALAYAGGKLSKNFWIERERKKESKLRGGKPVLGMPPKRNAFEEALKDARSRGKSMIDKYLVGFDLETGDPLWLDEDDICSHGCVFAKTGVGKTLFLESLIFQQMCRGRASGLTFIDAKRDSGTLADIILMSLVTGRIEDLIVVDPFDPVHCYNFVMTNQRADVKARKVLRAGLPPTSDQSSTKHYDRLAADSIYRMVRAFESFGLSWSIRDMAVALSAFNMSYPHLRDLLTKIGARGALVELGHLASSYRTAGGKLDTAKITENLRGIASELHAISGSEMGQVFCTPYTDLSLTDAIVRGKIIYFMLPRLEEAESAARMVKVFREDLEVSIGEVTSSRVHNLEDPHLVIIDEGSSTFGPTWANLFELARKGRFALLFGAQSTGGLTDSAIGLSEAFYERVMANVNLKVMMRVGDNRTAQEMAEWIGKVSTTKKSIGAGYTKGHTSSLNIAQSRRSGGESESISISEDEEDLVSAEELKHEMSAEKGLAWFDLGDGRIVKGRSFWFNSNLPDSWEGREYLTRLERLENDEIGLANWVDEQILHQEESEKTGYQAPSEKFTPQPKKNEKAAPSKVGDDNDKGDTGGSFKLSAEEGKKRGRGFVNAFPMGKPEEESKDQKTKTSEADKSKKSSSGGISKLPGLKFKK